MKKILIFSLLFGFLTTLSANDNGKNTKEMFDLQIKYRGEYLPLLLVTANEDVKIYGVYGSDSSLCKKDELCSIIIEDYNDGGGFDTSEKDNFFKDISFYCWPRKCSGDFSEERLGKNTPVMFDEKVEEELKQIVKWIGIFGIFEQYKLAKKYNKYYKVGLDDDGKRIKDYENIRLTKEEIDKVHKLMPKLVIGPYELSLQKGQTAKFTIGMSNGVCNDWCVFSIRTNKGIFSYEKGEIK